MTIGAKVFPTRNKPFDLGVGSPKHLSILGMWIMGIGKENKEKLTILERVVGSVKFFTGDAIVSPYAGLL